jgi:uncharacterized protein (UPF0264 family)
VLLDTHGKDGFTLLQWVSPRRLNDWVAVSGQEGLLTALAGGLRASDLAVVRRAEPAVIGVRGAACNGGRRGRVSVDRVRQLHRALTWVVPPSAQGEVGLTSRNAGDRGDFLPSDVS